MTSIFIKEKAAAESSTAAYAQIWNESSGTGVLHFEDDAGSPINVVMGQLTSTGIDDNATAERLQISNTELTFGDAASDTTMAVRAANSGGVIDFGAASGPAVRFFGGTHAQAGWIQFFSPSGTTTVLEYNSGWDFKDKTITTSGSVIAETSFLAGGSGAAAVGQVTNRVADGQLNLQAYGGTGARLDLYGASHGSLAGDVLFRYASATTLLFDKSAERWRIGESTGTQTARLVGHTSYGLYLAGGATVGANAALQLNGQNSTNPSDFEFVNQDNAVVFEYDYSLARLGMNYPFMQKEVAAATTSLASYGQWWVKNDAPNNPMFSDDAGTDFHLAKSSGTTGGTGSAGAGNQYIQINVGGTTYKVLHDGTV